MHTIRVTQIDGKLPNLALMKISHWHKARGDKVVFSRSTSPVSGEPNYHRVYASSIFAFSRDKTARLLETWPDAIVGGTGSVSAKTVEETLREYEYEKYDYSLYPWYDASLGFTQRGCRMSCKFCVVPAKEGKPRSVNSVFGIWRGQGHPKKLNLLDNDFFGQAESDWRARIDEIRAGDFRVCFNQGINVRVLTPDAAAALASVEYRDDQFSRRRLYTAWDNLKDEKVFLEGIRMLTDAGVKPQHLMVYMLVGFDKKEDWDRIWHRFNRMRDVGVLPYPMVFDCRATNPERYRELKRFQRWVVTGLYRAVPFSEYDPSIRRKKPVMAPYGNLREGVFA